MDTDSKHLIIVVDGGGSTCRVNVCDLSGNVLGHASAKSANIATDFDGALSNIVMASKLAYNSAGFSADRTPRDMAYLGLAGAGLPGAAKRMEDALEFARTTVTSDREIAVQGALGNDNGSVAHIGTGSFFVARLGNNIRNVGGWGFQLGDDGGGAILGRQLLRSTILAHDGIIAHSPLTRSILKRFCGSPLGLLDFVQSATPMDYGSFSPQLIEAFHDEDPIAREIVNCALSALIHTLDNIEVKSTGALYMMGGLGSFYQKLLSADYQSLCKTPKGDALSGGFELALKQITEDAT
ncbi:MAG: N-acetylglucosamine kinase [Devosiaceae bacterium]|nr:N-acetylglucosamine kinase [Devosiaceae bacterium]